MAEPIRLTTEELDDLWQEYDCGWWDVEQPSKIQGHIAYLDTEIVRLERSLDEARGVAAKLLDDIEAERPGSGLKWLHDFPWLKECTR